MPSAKQHQLLLMGPQSPIKMIEGFAYLDHAAVRVSLNRVFGFGGWSFDIHDYDLIEADTAPKKGGGTNHVVTYRVRGTLSVTFDDGTTATFSEVAVDKARHPEIEQAHDNAVKGAASMCLRRCAMNLGGQFGLGLYFSTKNKAYKGDPVAWTVDTIDEPPQPGQDETDGEPEGDDTRPDLTTPEGVAEAIENLKAGGVVSDPDDGVKA